MPKMPRMVSLYLPLPLSEGKVTRSFVPVQQFAKRSFDMSAALMLLFLLAPLCLLIAWLIRSHDSGPVLFRQTRIGKDGRRFTCLKFRSMVLDADRALTEYLNCNSVAAREWQESQKLSNDPRITRIGTFLRKTSLDELPQLINIILGDMSFVGPRPIVPDEVQRYGEHFPHCFSVTPGLTGLWQVSGRSDCTYATRIALDSRYAADWTLWLDVRILILTVPAVLRQKGSR
jgi:exopolysaccharide production protein ExoY